MDCGGVDHQNDRVWLQAKVRERGLGLQRRLYAGFVCDDSAAEAACAAIVTLCKRTLPFF